MLLVISTVIMMPSIYAEEEDEEIEDNGLMQREQEEENEDEEGSIPLGSGTGNIILYGTIAAIVTSIGYVIFKIVSSKRKSTSSTK